MAKRRVAYRKQHQNRFSMFLVSVVVIVLMVVLFVGGAGIKTKVDVYAARLEQLDKQLEEEQARTKEIEEYRKYTQTKAYVEEVARDKLGLVYEDEILFRQQEE